MLVSVIMPARNAGAYIGESIRSALDQSWKNLEVLVIDDQSTDDTAAVVSDFSDARLRLIRGNGRGAAAARNLGLQNSSGQWLMFLDADDVISPAKIELQLRAVRNTPDTVATCAWGHFTSVASELQICPQPCWRESQPLTWLQSSLAGGGMLQTACWLIPRQIAEAAGPWNEKLSLHDDGEYFTRVALQAREIHFVGGCHVAYRRVPGSLSRVRTEKAAASAFEVCQLRHQHLMGRDHSLMTRRALATQWAQVLYEFPACNQQLFDAATAHLAELNTEPNASVGGPTFRFLLHTIGCSAAVRVRRAIYNFTAKKVDS
jgi:glycosyltransferase involved in cell wall biosynthesis